MKKDFVFILVLLFPLVGTGQNTIQYGMSGFLSTNNRPSFYQDFPSGPRVVNRVEWFFKHRSLSYTRKKGIHGVQLSYTFGSDFNIVENIRYAVRYKYLGLKYMRDIYNFRDRILLTGSGGILFGENFDIARINGATNNIYFFNDRTYGINTGIHVSLKIWKFLSINSDVEAAYFANGAKTHLKHFVGLGFAF